MESPPRIREYGNLHAEWYELASASKDNGAELDFWHRCLKEAGEPALELGSGTGRVLVPLLEQGWNIHGLENSPHMDAICRRACEARGLSPTVHAEDMRTFAVPDRFGLIILTSGGLGLFPKDDDIRALFARVMEHLHPDGLFVYEYQGLGRLPEEDHQDSQWNGGWLVGPDDVVIAYRRMCRQAKASPLWQQLMIFEKFVAGRLVESEAAERMGRLFTVAEARAYAEAAGFDDIRVTHWLTEEPAADDTPVVTVRCRKPA